jgi:fatty-acid peroxygenase
VLAPEAAEELATDLLGRWRERLPAWETASEVNLFAEVGQLLCTTVCDWSGVPLPDRDVPARTRQLEALIDAGSGVAGRYWRARLARRRLEAWLAELVGQVRAGALTPRSGSALAVVAEHRELDGALLAPRVAAVDLLNVLRPTVAIDRFVVFLALALHQHPQWRSRLARAGTAAAGPDADDEVHRFVLEVRRLAPFFPLVAARAGSRLELDGLPVPVGTRVLLDLYGTNRDPSGWADPEAFDPDRFRGRQPGPYDFVPQGGGAHATGHRCAGEWVTAAVLHAATRLLTAEIEYEVVAGQDLRVSLRRIPTLPASGFRISHVRRLPPAGEG